MNTITQVSQITANDVAEYLRLPEVTDADISALNMMLGAAKNFITNYTGQTDLDQHQDFVTVVFVLCQDMWDNRSLYVDKTNLNKIIETTLGMHSINLLPEAEDANA